jgi:hypothetical protein
MQVATQNVSDLVTSIPLPPSLLKCSKKMKFFRQFYRAHNKAVFVLFGSLLCTLGSCENATHKAIQKEFEANVLKAVHDFRSVQKNDTLDLATINTAPWDTVYVFWGYSSLDAVPEVYPAINWGATIEEGIDKYIRRFIFVQEGQAVSYLDIKSPPLFDGVHYSKHYHDAATTDSPALLALNDTGQTPALRDNYFARAKAKFILVGGVDIRKPDLPNRGTMVASYAPLAYFKANYSVADSVVNKCELNLHPLSNCKLVDCIANRPTLNRKQSL